MAKQPQHAIDTAKIQQLVQALAQYGPLALAALQRFVDVLQSKQGAGAPAGAGASYGADVLTRVIDGHVAVLADLVYLKQVLAEEDDEGEYAPKAGQGAPQQGTGTTRGDTGTAVGGPPK
jgi:hypothetical protein